MPAVVIAILADARNAIAGLRDTGNAATTMGGRVKNAASAMSGPAVAALGGLGVAAYKAGQAAAELGDSIDASKIILGDAQKQVEDFANTAATRFGISKQSAIDAANAIGNFGSAAGLSGDALGKFTTDLIARAGDAASMFGGSAKDSVDAFGAALRGEFEPIRKYGVLINEGTIKAQALAGGLVQAAGDTTKIKAAQLAATEAQTAFNEATAKYGPNSLQAQKASVALEQAQKRVGDATAGVVPELTAQQKTLAVQQIIMAQTAKAQDNFANTAGSAKNQQEALKAQFADLTAELGTRLLPVMASAASGLREVLDWVKQNQGLAAGLAITLGSLAATVLAVNVAMKLYVAGQAIAAIGQRAWAIANNAWAVTQWAVNAAMAANPVGIIILAIVALVAIIVVAYKKNETFRKIVQKVMKDVSKAFGWLLDAAKKAFGWLKDNWKTVLAIITGPIGLAVLLVVKYWDQIKSATLKAFDAVKNAVSKALDTVKSVVSTVTAWVLARIKDYVGMYVAAWNGIVALYNKAVAVKDAIVAAVAALGARVADYLRQAVAGAMIVWEGIVGLWHKALWVRDAIFNAVANIIDGVRGYLQRAVDGARAVWNGIVSLADKAWELKDRIFAVFAGAWQWLVGAGEDVIRGLIRGIDNAWGWIKDKLGGVANLIPDWLKKVLGISSPSKVMADIGRNVVRGLVGGINAAAPLLRRSLGDVADTVAGLDPHIGVGIDADALSSRRTGGGVVNVTVNVPPTADLAEVGRQIVKAQKAYASSVGRAVVITP